MKSAVPLLLFAFLFGCATANYSPPGVSSRAENSAIIGQPKDSVWKTLISALSKEFFVINNLDKDTGLVNVSYSGDPSVFIDCGHVYLSNPTGTFSFAGAAARTEYTTQYGLLNSVQVTRTIELEGRANLLVQDIDPSTTRVSASVRYIVSRTLHGRDMARGFTQSSTERTTFNTGQSGTMSASFGLMTCRPTGLFEQRLLELAGRASAQIVSSQPSVSVVQTTPLTPTIATPATATVQAQRPANTIEVGRNYQVAGNGLSYAPQIDFSKKIDLPISKAFRVLERISVWNTWVYQIELPARERGFIKEQDALGHLKAGRIVEETKTAVK